MDGKHLSISIMNLDSQDFLKIIGYQKDSGMKNVEHIFLV